ncbi:hypothetical protein B9Z19DRAFT_1078919 [Tuber borchii]|uniref:Uncharacterized protein n=1 Tax=Tuber borchii TaxID=42251 RepID=A0A2T6ZYS3_TUBBO|nr:hypothetical protein B9Z19DRAFT_1078919 [Tuber borchii]
MLQVRCLFSFFFARPPFAVARAPVLSASLFSRPYDVGIPAILANFDKLLLPLLLPLLFFFLFLLSLRFFVATSCFTSSSLLLLSFEFSLFIIIMVDRVGPLRGLFPNYGLALSPFFRSPSFLPCHALP